jgi:hypothetical protein
VILVPQQVAGNQGNLGNLGETENLENLENNSTYPLFYFILKSG